MSTTMKLYEIAAIHRSIFDAIEAEGGELTPDLEAALDASTASLASKVDACCVRRSELAIREAEAQGLVAAIEAELDRAKARRDGFARERANLEAYMMRSMEAAGETRIDTGRFSPRIQLNQPSAKWTGPADKIPAEFQRVKTTTEFDKTAAAKAYSLLKEGESLPEGVVVTRTKKLVIK